MYLLFYILNVDFYNTQHMISRVLHNKKAIRRVLGNDKDTSHLVPKWQDWKSWKVSIKYFVLSGNSLTLCLRAIM